MYYLNEFFDGEQTCNTIIKLLDGGILNIPISKGNPQYEAYLRWVEEGNVVGSWAEYTTPPPVELPPMPLPPRSPDGN
jgi:hypothetical protein